MTAQSAFPGVSAEIFDFAQEALDRWDVPGAAIAILKDGETSFASFGVTSLDTMQLVTSDTLFRVASISKPFTATLAMTLVNDGLLDLDTPITDYLPGIALTDGEPAWQAAITMRHLLSHTAGIDCELPVDLASVGQGDDALRQAIELYGGLHQWAAPGQIMSYGNTGFWLAGHVIAIILGSTFEDAMRERVLRPLGLERTVFTAEEAIVYPVALGHQPKSLTDGTHELIRSYAYPRARTPSGGVISTVADLLEFSRWHIGDSDRPISLSSELRDSMRNPIVRLRAADNETWGIGWDLTETTDGTAVIGHGGSYGGFQTKLTIAPSRKFALAILTNSARGGMANAEIENLVLKQELGLTALAPTPIVLPADALAEFAGTYRQPLSSYELRVASDGLDIVIHATDLTGNPQEAPLPIRLKPIGERDFIVMNGDFKGLRADFIHDAETGTPTHVRIGLRIAERVG